MERALLDKLDSIKTIHENVKDLRNYDLKFGKLVRNKGCVKLIPFFDQVMDELEEDFFDRIKDLFIEKIFNINSIISNGGNLYEDFERFKVNNNTRPFNFEDGMNPTKVIIDKKVLDDYIAMIVDFQLFEAKSIIVQDQTDNLKRACDLINS